MKKIISDKLIRITKNKRKLQEKLNVKITNRGKEVYIKGQPEDEYTAEKVIDAVNFGFPFTTALLIKEEGANFEILNIKDYTKRNDLESVRARIIGKHGKTLQTLSQLTNCNLELKDNNVAIIGDPEFIENVQNALISIIQGSKQTNVYSFLEKHRVQPVIDLGLKNTKE